MSGAAPCVFLNAPPVPAGWGRARREVFPLDGAAPPAARRRGLGIGRGASSRAAAPGAVTTVGPAPRHATLRVMSPT